MPERNDKITFEYDILNTQLRIEIEIAQVVDLEWHSYMIARLRARIA